MSTTSREAQARFSTIADGYRKAFAQVQAVLSNLDLGSVPNWVFAIDRLPLAEIKQLSPELHHAEERRRRWKAALHAYAELMALEETRKPPVDPNADPFTSLDTADDANLAKLDRFISVINMARAGGCIYVDGTFEPVERPIEPEDSKDTMDLPQRRSDASGDAAPE